MKTRFQDKSDKDKGLFILQQAIYIVVITFCFFLMFLGVLRTFEVNDYFNDKLGAEQYSYIKTYCSPRGFFGWGYDCDLEQYQKDMGYNPPQRFPDVDWNYSFNISE